ncbi:MAG TPA: 6-bladed beta-propeller [Gemmatimonadaceae bacterium]|nr:6-bladed beta-propeller [Gemmatimonadaceae bacterium]
MFVLAAALVLATTQQRADTLVVRGNGDVPASAVRRLVPEWQASDASAEIGTVDGMAVAPDGRVYVWDEKTPSLWMLNADGTGLKRIGRKGAGPGEYDGINGITIRPDGKLAAWDAGNSRINIYNADGSFVANWLIKMSGRTYTSGALTADVRNRVWMQWSVPNPANPTDRQQNLGAIVGYDLAGVLRDTIIIPQYPGDPILRAQSPDGGSRMGRTLPFGTSTRSATSPLGFVVSGPGRPYVFNTTFNGRPVRVEREYTPVAVTRDERDKYHAQLEASMRRTQPDWKWSGPDIPDTKPAYGSFLIGAEGRIWVQLSVESEKYTPDAPATAQPNPLPVVPYRSRELRWDIYEPDGKFVGRVAVARGFTPYAARGDAIWGVTRDADDVPTVVKLRPAR